MEQTAVCIVGAGPAGATLSHFLNKSGIDHWLIDKDRFPRDKVCGDGLTVDVLNVLKRIDPVLRERFAAESTMLPAWGFCFRAPNGRELRYDFRDDGFAYAPFYTARRLDLDDFLVRNLPPNRSGQYHFGTSLKRVTRQSEGFQLTLEKEGEELQLQSRFLIGAEGEKPVVSKQLGLKHYRVKANLIAALRVYYQGVKGFNPGNHLEFIFDSSLLPGYFWAFPLANGEANVGLGMVSTAIARRKANLKKLLPEVTEKNPHVREMMTEAQALEKPQGWGLPTLTKARQIAGEGYALIGDAGGMIEPFTGKGIGTGMMSARICSEHLAEALKGKNRDLRGYENHMYEYYHSEIRAGYTLQKTLKYPPVLNLVLGASNLKPLKRWSHQKMVREWNRWM